MVASPDVQALPDHSCRLGRPRASVDIDPRQAREYEIVALFDGGRFGLGGATAAVDIAAHAAHRHSIACILGGHDLTILDRTSPKPPHSSRASAARARPATCSTPMAA
jgi:hypothetical protein